ncbi:MAG: DNA topoisomerase 3 [Acidobacteria bacterium]|nr:DNA topoisomerase 3 [Acidobacteriota bacterium]MBV9929037.1 DNA topoisomerase 3 [Acidobacteriota bacterium]
MRLIVTEKPSMGRDVAAALGAARRGEGFISGESEIVTWCVGHLVELDDPQAYDPRFERWRVEDLPILPGEFKYHPSERTLEQFNVIRALLGREDVVSVVNAADAGREGELIFDLVYTLAGCRKPVERLWISSLTREAIQEGFRNLKPAEEYKGLRESAHARQRADWLVGINATRAQTVRARRAGHEGVFSLGRVQTPTLALIVERDREISEFVPTDYFEVVADFRAPGGEYRGRWFGKDGSRFDKKDDAEAVVRKVQGKQGAVQSVEKKAAREKPPLLHDLTSLQRAANVRYAFTAAKTLELAQSLYEKKFLTYPRTSSRHLSKAVAEEIEAHVRAASVGPYVPFIEKILAGGKPKLTSRHVDDKKVTDHHAVIPTKQKIKGDSLSPDEKRIYDLVARRFLAAFYPDAELERTTVVTEAEGERFITRGTVVLKAGWREVEPPGRGGRSNEEGAKKAGEEEEEEAAELPALKAKDPAEVLNAEALAKQTKAPPRYSESALLGAMETAGKKVEDEELRLAMKEAGLGTPATRASIIETLLKREYVTREKKSLVATAKGAALIKMLPSPLLKSAELTGRWEQKLSRMARREYELDAFMVEVRGMVSELVAQIAGSEVERPSQGSAQARQLPRPEGALDCPKCKREGREGFLVEREGAAGKFLACSAGREACGYLSDAPKNAKQRKALLQTPCQTCGGAMRLRLPKEKGKRAFLSCVRYPDCRGARWFDDKGALEEPRPEPEAGPPCLLCKTPMLKRGPTSAGSFFWSCPRWRSDGSGCNARPVWINERAG